METVNEYGNGRQSVIDEVRHYIESELGKLSYERRQIPDDTKDLNLSHKRATIKANWHKHGVVCWLRLKQIN